MQSWRGYAQRAGAFGLFLAFALPLGGCCCTGKREKQKELSTALLFNPGTAGMFAYDMPRSDWPATVAYDQSGEEIIYQERITDRQGWFGSDRDHMYRRFDSVRIGRGVR